MKKIYLSFSMLLMVSVTMAQSSLSSSLQVGQAIAKEIIPIENSVAAGGATDTLGLSEFGSNIVFYASPTGYVFGTNDLEGEASPGQPIHQFNYQYAAGFIVNESYNVLGAMMWFGAKHNVSGNPADLKLNMYSLNDDKALSAATVQEPDVIGPDQLLGSIDLPFEDVDTASFNTPTYAFFSNPVWYSEDFALSVDLTNLYGTASDTVMLYADEDGDSDGSYTWTELGFDIAPVTFWALSTGMLQGGLDVNLAIFAIVAESPNSIEEQGYLNGVKMTTYPNPALFSDNVTIQYGVESYVKNVEFNIFDMNGKQMFTSSLGSKSAGLYNLSIPSGTLSAGSYIYSIEADGGRMAKRMEILE
jgi:hypothetical protein